MAESQTDKHAQLASSGVEALIERLREQGVDAGRVEADKIVVEARRRAAQIVHEAETHAAELVEAARKETRMLQTGGEEALRIAMRDTVLRLKVELSERFGAEVRRLIAVAMDQESFLKQLILAVAGRAREEAGVDAGEAVQIQLPLELREGSLSHFVLSLAGNVLTEGVTFGVAGDDARGIRLYLKDKDVTIDLTDEKVAALLLQHLQPRFRAILEGTVK
jgi:V/A-type H+-transporting ATPase subunit E